MVGEKRKPRLTRTPRSIFTKIDNDACNGIVAARACSYGIHQGRKGQVKCRSVVCIERWLREQELDCTWGSRMRKNQLSHLSERK
jgi:hypothetical protein